VSEYSNTIQFCSFCLIAFCVRRFLVVIDYEHVLLDDNEDDNDACNSLLLTQYLKYTESKAPSVFKSSGARLMFEITSDDGFFVRADTCEGMKVEIFRLFVELYACSVAEVRFWWSNFRCPVICG